VNTVLQAHALRKSFGEFTAVDGVDLSLAEGELTAIIGPNGAGKTTLINLLSGALQADSGHVTFRGQDITGVPSHRRVLQGLTRSFQVMNVFPRLTVRDNVLVPILTRLRQHLQFVAPVATHADAMGEAERMMQSVGLSELRHQPAGVLSHGDQRRLELAIAIAANPVCCLLDEPSSGMTPMERRGILELIRQLCRERNTTFVIVEHDMDVVFSLAVRIVVMNRGRILADGIPEAIRGDRAVREIYLGDAWRP